MVKRKNLLTRTFGYDNGEQENLFLNLNILDYQKSFFNHNSMKTYLKKFEL
jgi:hypothetical protein